MLLENYDLQYREVMKVQAEKQTGLKLDYIDSDSLKTNKGYTVGKKYYIGYWGNVDECISINNGYITVKGQDGEIRTHFTVLDAVKDFIVIE